MSPWRGARLLRALLRQYVFLGGLALAVSFWLLDRLTCETAQSRGDLLLQFYDFRWQEAVIHLVFAAILIGCAATAQVLLNRSRRSEDKYRTTVECSNDLIWILDTEGCFTYMNRRAEEVSGYRLEDVRGTGYSALLRAEDLDRINEVFSDNLDGKSVTYEVDGLREDGSIFSLHVNATPIFNGGEVVGTASFGRDITKEKEAETALDEAMRNLRLEHRRIEELLVAAVNVQEQERFHIASEIHDELLQSLVATSYFVESLDAPDQETSGRKTRLVAALNDAVAHGRELIQNVRPLELSDFDLVDSIGETAERRIDSRSTRIEYEHPDKLPKLDFPVKTGALRVVQEALVNVSRHSQASHVFVRISSDGGELEIVVRDDGVGFDAAAAGDGHLGLQTMRGRAELVGGRVEVVSEPGEGTLVRAVFPLR